MSKRQSFLDLTDQVLTEATQQGVMHLYTEDDSLNGREIHVQGKSLINFGSCSYLGLEKDQRLIDACCDAARRYGTQFSSSRAYMSSGQYLELESLFVNLFSAHCLVMPTTSLGHLSAIPALVDQGDIAILDHQVHASVQNACQLLKARGDMVDIIRHSDLNALEEKIKKYRRRNKRIWYFIDGVYSMYGDLAPVKELYELLDRYPELHIYADDAHGFSWSGEKGKGSIRGATYHHERLVLALSLNKAFGAAGGLLVFPNLEMKRRVRACGGGVVFSGPIQPPLIGAAIASAKIHVSGEVESLQKKLMKRIAAARSEIQRLEIPDVANVESPIFFIGVGQLQVGYNLCRRLMHEGFYTNMGLFPAVPINRTGIRFTTTVHQDESDLIQLVQAMAHHLPLALEEEGSSIEEVHRAFKLNSEEIKRRKGHTEAFLHPSETISQTWEIEEYSSCLDLPQDEWNLLLGSQGSYDINGLAMLEKTFARPKVHSVSDKPEDHWQFRYLIIRDAHGAPILATIGTKSLIKADMFAAPDISQKAEFRRKEDKYAFTSQCIMMGTCLTEGSHLYLNKNNLDWRSAVAIMLRWLVDWRDSEKADLICLRDFTNVDTELDEFLQGKSFLKIRLPDSHYVPRPVQFYEPEFLKGLSKKHRHHWRHHILPFNDLYDTKIIPGGRDFTAEEKIDHWYELYLQVSDRALDINTFKLPRTLFANLIKTSGWEAIELTPKGKDRCASVVFAYWNGDRYCPMVVGMDYNYLDQGIYRQSLFHLGMRAKELSAKSIQIGFGASLEKRRIGAKAQTTYAYMQAVDTFDLEALSTISK